MYMLKYTPPPPINDYWIFWHQNHTRQQTCDNNTDKNVVIYSVLCIHLADIKYIHCNIKITLTIQPQVLCLLNTLCLADSVGSRSVWNKNVNWNAKMSYERYHFAWFFKYYMLYTSAYSVISKARGFFLQIPRLVKVVEDDSLYFKVVSPVDVCKKVAPGMASTFTVLFTPQENKVHFT